MPEPITIKDSETREERGLINRVRERIRRRLREQGRTPRGAAGPGARTQG